MILTEARIKARKKIRKILGIGIGASIYGILVNFLVGDFEMFLVSGFSVLMVDATALYALHHIRKRMKEREEQEEKNKKFNP